ncbi:MAG: AMP-binding protein [Fibromonadales bacterium]|nr:AMP-binding protein [Fibromonadales bacterium]
MNSIVCYNEEGVKTQADFFNDISAVRKFAIENKKRTYILHSENLYYFAVAFIGILQAKKTLAISANISPEFIKEISDEETHFFPEEEIKMCTCKGASVNQQFDIDPQSDVILWTSGTTGNPKKIQKKYHHLSTECKELADLWGDAAKDCLFCETVNHHHIYGLLFSFLLPLRLGAPFLAERIEMPETLEKLQDKKIILASSPAFLKRISKDSNIKSLRLAGLFCSGGVLPFESAKDAQRILGQWPVEIYGSTETGGIAHRISKNGLEWAPFSVCSISLADNGCLCVKSPYIAEQDGFVTGDLVEFLDNGNFVLSGRADSIVKIEEKRISLTEVENRILSSGLAQEACVLALSGKRQYLAAAIVLNAKGKEKFFGTSKLQINSFFKDHLSKFLENSVIPKKWRYVEAFAQDAQGKIKRQDVEKLFFLEKICAELFFAANNDFFDGHFPQFALLPAVAQIDTVIKVFNKFFGTNIILKRISRIKFTTPIRPNSKVQLQINYCEKEKMISFEFFDMQNKKYSSGTFFCDFPL